MLNIMEMTMAPKKCEPAAGVGSNRYTLAATVLIFLLTLFAFESSLRAQAYTPVEDCHLKGINVISVFIKEGPEYGLLRDQLDSQVGGSVDSAVVDGLTRAFPPGDLPSIIAAKELKQPTTSPNIFQVTFLLSAQPDVIIGKHVKVATLWVRYGYYLPDNKQADIKAFDASYPFIVPDNREEFLKKIGQGAYFLTRYLPTMYYCCTHEAREDYFRKLCSPESLKQDPWLADTFYNGRRQ